MSEGRMTELVYSRKWKVEEKEVDPICHGWVKLKASMITGHCRWEMQWRCKDEMHGKESIRRFVKITNSSPVRMNAIRPSNLWRENLRVRTESSGKRRWHSNVSNHHLVVVGLHFHGTFKVREYQCQNVKRKTRSGIKIWIRTPFFYAEGTVMLNNFFTHESCSYLSFEWCNSLITYRIFQIMVCTRISRKFTHTFHKWNVTFHASLYKWTKVKWRSYVDAGRVHQLMMFRPKTLMETNSSQT